MIEKSLLLLTALPSLTMTTARAKQIRLRGKSSRPTMPITPLNGQCSCMKYASKSVIKSGLSAFGIKIYRNRGGGIDKIVGFFGDIRCGFTPRGIIHVGANRGDQYGFDPKATTQCLMCERTSSIGNFVPSAQKRRSCSAC